MCIYLVELVDNYIITHFSVGESTNPLSQALILISYITLWQYLYCMQQSVNTFLHLYLTTKAMDSTKSKDDTSIHIKESNSSKSRAATPIAVIASTKATGGWKRGVAIFDFILRLCGIAAALAATATMGTTDQTLPFFTQFFQFQASYDDLPAFTFFVIANAIASGYLVLSLPFSIVGIIRPHLAGVRLLLLVLDTVLLALTSAAASAAAAIVYLAHTGNTNTNWLAICQQFNDFCQRVSGAVVASFIAVLIFIFLVLLSAVAITRP